MKLTYRGKNTIDIPALGLAGVKPGDTHDVDDPKIAADLRAQGWEPARARKSDTNEAPEAPTSEETT